jgi:uncharacterized protein (TIGR02266 family)
MPREQRRFSRRTATVQFHARDAEGVGTLVFESADLSAGGTFLRSDLLLEEGEPLSLEFTIPGRGAKLTSQGRVVWVRRFPKDGEEAGMGVEFLAMSDDDRIALHDYLGEEPGEEA